MTHSQREGRIHRTQPRRPLFPFDPECRGRESSKLATHFGDLSIHRRRDRPRPIPHLGFLLIRPSRRRGAPGSLFRYHAGRGIIRLGRKRMLCFARKPWRSPSERHMGGRPHRTNFASVTLRARDGASHNLYGRIQRLPVGRAGCRPGHLPMTQDVPPEIKCRNLASMPGPDDERRNPRNPIRYR